MNDETARRITAASVEWHRLHAEARRLLAERNVIDCERTAANAEMHDGDELPPAFPVACFRDYCMPGRQPDDYPVARPPAEWCRACRRRHVLHQQARETRRAAGAANRRVQALCRSAARAAQE